MPKSLRQEVEDYWSGVEAAREHAATFGLGKTFAAMTLYPVSEDALWEKGWRDYVNAAIEGGFYV